MSCVSISFAHFIFVFIKIRLLSKSRSVPSPNEFCCPSLQAPFRHQSNNFLLFSNPLYPLFPTILNHQILMTEYISKTPLDILSKFRTVCGTRQFQRFRDVKPLFYSCLPRRSSTWEQGTRSFVTFLTITPTSVSLRYLNRR